MTNSSLQARFATAAEITDWDNLIVKNPDGGHILSSATFAAVKKMYGWLPRYVVFTAADNAVQAATLVLERSIPALGKLWYIPAGPGEVTAPAIADQLKALKALAQSAGRGVFTITFDPLLPVPADFNPETDRVENFLPQEFAALGAVSRTTVQVSVAHTAIVDIAQAEEELLASFDKKCRNMVRRAARDEVDVYEVAPSPDTYQKMHRLMQLVGGGKAQLETRSKQYVQALWDGFTAKGQGKFYAANGADGEPAVMNFAVVLGKRAYYLHGGSERPRTTPGMANLVIYKQMLDSQAQGATSQDMFGIAPGWAKSTEDHLNYGLGEYKLSFSKARTDRTGSYDLVLKPLHYKIWRKIGERAAGKLHRQKYQDLSMF